MYFSCIGFHCIYSCSLLNLTKDDCSPTKNASATWNSVLILWLEYSDLYRLIFTMA